MSDSEWGDQVGADELCADVEAWLRANLGGYLGDLSAPRVILQGPSPDAMQSGMFPAICISSPGLTEPPQAGRDRYAATWSIVVSVWVRGPKLDATARLTRQQVKAIRSCLLAWGRGTWTDEGYAQVDDPAAAGTMGAGFVELAVAVPDAVNLNTLPPGGPLLVVTSTEVLLTPKE